jgi:hypothetical protein
VTRIRRLSPTANWLLPTIHPKICKSGSWLAVEKVLGDFFQAGKPPVFAGVPRPARHSRPERHGISQQLERIQPPCLAGSGAAKVSSLGEDTPNAPRAFADPLAYLSQFVRSSLQLFVMRSSVLNF